MSAPLHWRYRVLHEIQSTNDPSIRAAADRAQVSWPSVLNLMETDAAFRHDIETARQRAFEHQEEERAAAMFRESPVKMGVTVVQDPDLALERDARAVLGDDRVRSATRDPRGDAARSHGLEHAAFTGAYVALERRAEMVGQLRLLVDRIERAIDRGDRGRAAALLIEVKDILDPARTAEVPPR